MRIAHRGLFVIVLVIFLAITAVNAQDTPPADAPTATLIPTDIPTDVPTATAIPTETFTPEPSLTPLPPPTVTDLPSPTEIPSLTPSLTATATDTLQTQTEVSPTLTATATASASLTASATVSLTPSAIPSAEIHNQLGIIAPLANPIACSPTSSIQQANVSSTGERGDVSGNLNSLSADGRYLYFPSRAANLVTDDTNGMVDYFEFDRTNCQTRRITLGSNGEQGDGDSDVGNISGNGQYFAFASKASNFVAGDANGKYDIFVKDLQTNAVTRIPADPNNLISTPYYIGDVTISDDGRYIAFDVLVPNGSGFIGTPVLYDLQTSTRTVIAAEGRSLYISGNGKYIAFVSSRPDLVAGDTNGVDNIFLYEIATGTFKLVADDTQITIQEDYPSISISNSGDYVVFTAISRITANDTNNLSDVYIYHWLTHKTILVSVKTDGTQFAGGAVQARLQSDGSSVVFFADGGIWVREGQAGQTYPITNPYTSNGGLDMSADGQYIAFSTSSGTAPDIVRDVYVAKRSAFVPPTPTPTETPAPLTATAAASATYAVQTATAIAGNCVFAGFAPLQLASVNFLGNFPNNNSGVNSLAISDTGRYVAFVSSASDLVPSDINGFDDAFVFDKQKCQVSLISKSLANVQANGGSTSLAMSADGQIIAFAASATNLIPNQTADGIFVRNLTANTIIHIPTTGSMSRLPSISGDGRYVTYTQNIDANTRNIMLYDTQTDQLKLIESVTSNATYSKISRDGSVVVYYNSASLLTIYTLSTQNITPQPTINVNVAALFDVSANGQYIVFGSDATNLVANDTNGKTDIFLLDRQTAGITRLSVSTSGTQAANNSAFPSISPDGRYVSFGSSASNLVANDTNNMSDVFVRDRLQQQTYLISLSVNGVLANNGAGGAGAPISGNNQYIAFVSAASNLLSGDTNLKSDVFVASNAALQSNYSATATAIATAMTATPTPTSLTPSATINPFTTVTPGGPIPCLPSAITSLASVSSAGILPNNLAGAPQLGPANLSISDTGRYIVYVSSATNLVPNDTNGKEDLFIFDRENCLTTRLSTALDGTQANDNSKSTAISADGQVIVFGSLATNLIPGDANGGFFIRDFQNNTLIRISDVANASELPSISADGRYITFPEKVDANTKNIVLYDRQLSQKVTIDTVTNVSVAAKISHDGSKVVYFYNNAAIGVYDRVSQQKSIKSINTFGNPYFGVSGDGRYVTFSSNANNLVASDGNNDFDVFLWDRITDQVSLISVNSNGIQGNGLSAYPDISADGRYVTFFSSATNFAANDTNNTVDVFVRDLVRQVTYAVSAAPDQTLGNQSSGIYGSPISADNRFVVFVSAATNLVAGVTGSASRVFVAQRSAFAPPDLSATQTAGAPATATANAIATATYSAVNGLVVNTTDNTNDGTCNATHCSLVEAVNASNAMNGVQIIKFNIPGTGVHTITLSSSLILTSSAVIDGTTQTGYSGVPLIEIIPQSATTPANAIVINGATPTTYDPNTSVTIRGLIINSFSGFGIYASNGQQHLFEENYIGTNATGTVAKGNDTGIVVTSPNSIIRNNLISGNLNDGLYLFSTGGRNATGNVIVGNRIGTEATGTTALPNKRGIRLLQGASNNVIGGVAASPDANVISGNSNEGILINDSTSTDNVILGNLIGLSFDTNYLVGNGGFGISISGALNTTIGGGSGFDTNDIWGNLAGISVSNGANNTIIQSNTIAQNGAQGIIVSTNNTTIVDNTIMFHTSRGIVISSGTGNRIRANHISDNGGMGIDLASSGVTANDVNDADSGANNLQNFPVISGVIDNGSNLTVTGTLNSQPNQNYHLEFFNSSVCSISGYGEGSNYAGSAEVTTNANGVASFTAQIDNLISGNNSGANWSGTFFPSNNLTGTGVSVSNIQGLNFNWGTGAPIVNGTPVAGMPSDNFSARFTSKQNFTAGNYTFIASSDDGIRVYIDGVLALDKFVGRPLTTDKFSIALLAGQHTLTVEYFEGTDQASLQLQWHFTGFVTATAMDSGRNTSEFSACVPVQLMLGVGGYQENNGNLAYSGNWVSYSGAGPVGGSYKYTNDANAKVSFQVENTVGRITFYRTTYTIYGATQIYLDGAATPFATMNNSSPSFLFGVPFTINIPQGNHTIELRNVGSNYSSLDYIDLLPPAQPLTVNTYQETEPNLSYSGNWVPNTTSSALGGSRSYTNDPNATVSFKINNTVGRVTIYRTTYLAGVYGSMQVFIDGAETPFTTINNTSSAFLFQQPFTFAVTPGNHTIELRNVGSTFSDIDQITLAPPATTLTNGTYQETDANLTYSGTWTSASASAALGGTRIYTNDPNASVSFNVDVGVVRVTIYRTTYVAGVYGSMQVFVDGASTPLTTINNTSSAFLYGQPFTFTVTPGGHTITLKNVGSTYSDIDQIKLQAAAAPLTGGNIYQETDANLTYNGLWTSSSTQEAFGGSRIYTNDPNATVSFNIDANASHITIYRTTYVAGVYGAMQVFLDGAAIPLATIDNTSSTFLYRQPFTFSVKPGNHTVTLKNVGTTYSDIDQIEVWIPWNLTVGDYQETEARLVYNGKWTSSATTSALGGARKYTNDPNATVSFNIDSSVGRITVYRTTYLAGVYGALQVYLDNNPTPFTTINNTSSAFLFQQPVTFLVTPGNHVVTLKNVGTTFSDIDQISVAAPAPLSTGIYQETEPKLSYNGAWTLNTTASALGGARKYTNDPNASVSFTIDNTVGQVTLYRTTYAAGVYGAFQVYLDNNPVSLMTINNTSSAFLFQQPVTFLVTPGNHVVTLKNVGTTFSDVDQITLSAPAPLAMGTYQETDPNLVYTGVWTSNSTTSALGGARKYTNDPNATVSFSIDSFSSTLVTIYRTTYLAGVYGSFEVLVDGSTTPIATINNTSASFLFQQPFSFTLNPGPHTITLKNVGTTFSDLDQITLQVAS